MLSMDDRKAMMEANPPTVDYIFSAQSYFDWSWKGCGFGQLEVFLSKDGTLVIENECMDRARVRKILHAWADFVADRAILRDNPEDIPPVDFQAEKEEIARLNEQWELSRARK